MTLIIVAAPKGMLAGYGMAALIVSLTENWEWAFYIIILSMIPLMAILAFMNSKSIDIKVYVRQKQMKLNETNNTDASATAVNISEPVSNEAMSYLSNANSPSANRTKYQRL